MRLAITLFSFTLFSCCCKAIRNSYTRPNVCVIGGGVGGLVSSTIISQAGYQVDLIEKNPHCGGRLSSEFIEYGIDEITTQKKRYRFDTGPSLLLLPEIYQETFSLIGLAQELRPVLLRVEPLYKCYFQEDKTFSEISNDPIKMNLASNLIEPDGYTSFTKYMRIANSFLAFGLPTVINEKWLSLSLSRIFDFVLSCLRVFPLLSHKFMLSKYFKTSKFRAMMSFQNLYIGLSPNQAPAVFSLLQALELEQGIWYPKGGFGTISAALETAARNAGVNIFTNSETTHVTLNDSFDRISSVRVSQMTASDSGIAAVNFSSSADMYVANIDVPEFDQQFIPQQSRDNRAIESVPSCGVISLHLAFNRTLKCLAHHTLYISEAYDDSWNIVDNPDTSSFNPDQFNFYVHAPSRTDPTVCPPGHDAITVLVPVPPLPLSMYSSVSSQTGFEADPTYNSTDTTTNTLTALQRQQEQLKSVVRSAVLLRLQEMEDAATKSSSSSIKIKEYLVMERARDPTQWRREFGLHRGSAFGLAHSLSQLSFFRPRFKHPKVTNLYRVGASVRPGNGVPLVMVGGRLVAETILRDLNIDHSRPLSHLTLTL